ncbi:hypothetical protein FPSE_03314 [Fusarium pseudograminearum CS3096]|uniref:Uncharacterized protein n=1 Tax=Fusarium pseudograminearum (strain CS3096) TaxID=1028729 RepID=K3VNS0_FUSPC|nr:hypothetical protein FPSE_03314 [Fusarium pseudograminearum CS3096]EKJ76554.1 hypothetical protein FPSE_03314 [Fusarium pseudograminearum CS3096]
MEAVGLVLGVAGLFSTCIEAVEKVQSYRSFGPDSSTINTRFQTAKVLLEQWGRSVGFENGILLATHNENLDDPDTVVAVKDVLNIIKSICQLGSQHRAANGANGSLIAGRRQKLKWAFGDKEKQQEQVELLERLVEQLRHLVSEHHLDPKVSQSHASIADIKSILSRIEKETRGEIRKEVLLWIGHGPTDQRYHDSLQKRHAETCNWIYDREAFQRWLTPDSGSGLQALWISGPAGFGKTVLAASIVNHLSTTLDTPVAHFFLTSESKSRDDPFLAVRTWIAQVISEHQGAFQCAHHAWEEDRDPIAPRAIHLRLLAQIAQLIPGCAFVIDGLDECVNLHNHNASATAFIKAINDALSTTSSRFLVVSRDDPHIRHATANNFNEYTILSSDVHADTVSVSQEIINRKLNKKSDEFRNSLSETMVTRCEGQFLWLRLQEESLRNGMNMKKLRSVVESTPLGLEALYEREWSRIVKSPDYDRIISLLRWAAFAIRPLNVAEITEAVLIGDFEDFPLDDLPDEIDDDYVETEIVGLCAPLIQMIHRCEDKGTGSLAARQTVHLAHFSVKEFLLTQLPAPGAIQANTSLVSQYQHTLLATACLQYINFENTWADTADDVTPPGAVLRGYAGNTWRLHFNSGLTSDETAMNLVTALFDEENSVWGRWRSWYHMQLSNIVEQGNANVFTRWMTENSGPISYAIIMGLDFIADKLIPEYISGVRDMADVDRVALLISRDLGRQNMLEKLLKSGVSAKAAEPDGTSILYLAACCNSSQVVQILIDRGADVAATNRKGFTPLHVARNADIARILIQSGAVVDARANDGRTPLHLAADSDILEVIDILLDMGATVDARDEMDFTPLHSACGSGCQEAARRLIANGASLVGAIHMACAMGHNKVVQMLVHEGACIEERWKGSSAIQLAACMGKLETFKLLLDLGVNIHTKDEYGDRTLHLVCRRGHTQIIKALIDAGADIEELNTLGFTPLAVSCFYGHLDAANALIAAGSQLSSIIKPHGGMLLGKAVEMDYTKIVNLLIDNGVDIADRNEDGCQALDIAASHGRTKLVKQFIRLGAPVSGANKIGRTCLHQACLRGNLETVRLLLDAGSDLSSIDNRGFTCLHLASFSESIEIVKDLVARGLSISKKSFKGSTALHCAVSEGSVEIVKYLLDEGALLEEVTNDGHDTMDIAVSRGQLDILECLIEASPEGTINNARPNFGGSRLHMATYGHHTKSVETLLSIPGIEPNRIDNSGRTALLLAAREGFDDIVQILVDDARVDPNLIDWFGSTPLFAAVRNNHVKVLEVLLKSPKITTDIRDGYGIDLYWWAERFENPEVLSILQQYLGEDEIFPDDPVSPDLDINLTPFDPDLHCCNACLISTQEPGLYEDGDLEFVFCPDCWRAQAWEIYYERLTDGPSAALNHSSGGAGQDNG